MEPNWLPADEVVAINRDEVEETGEPFALIRPELLESAIWRPRHRFDYDGEADVVVLAVALLIAIATNHPFEQGNKRTAFTAAVVFLAINGYRLDVPDVRTTSQLVIDVLTGTRPEKDLVDLFRAYVSPSLD